MPEASRRYLIPLVILLLGCVATHSLRQASTDAPPQSVDLGRIPLELGGFAGRELPPDESVFAYLGADEMIDRLYTDEEQTRAIKLSVIFARGWRALHSPRDCFRNQGWALIREERAVIPAPDGGAHAIDTARLVMDKPGNRIAAVYTFATVSATTGSWLRHSARMALSGGRGGALAVAVATSQGPADDADALLAAQGVALEATVHLKKVLGGAGKAELGDES